MDKKLTHNLLLSVLRPDEIKIDEPLKNHTYTQIGGKADFLVFPETHEEVQKIVQETLQAGIPVTVLGNGSNVIIQDGGIRGVVLNLTRLTNISLTGKRIVADAGVPIIGVSRFALDQKLSGLEFACGIPGTVGGAVYMNAGAYGGEIADVIESVILLTENGQLVRLSKNELKLEYRKSIVAENGFTVLEATFLLEEGEYDKIQSKMAELTFMRESKQPLEYPSCGSVFKRPPGYFAGKLIQDCDLQGYQIGGAQVSKKHAGFIVNINHASAKDYIQLISHVQSTVQAKFHIALETEVKIIGESALE